MSQWQDISTAPMWKAVLIKTPTVDYFGNNGILTGLQFEAAGRVRWVGFGWACNEVLTGKGELPTHWMPIPSPPEGA